MRILYILLATVFHFATMSEVHAALGEIESKVGNDQIKMRANRVQRSSKSNYSIHELISDAHTVKEYVGHDGTVFAVSWQGNLRPNLKDLLGVYFDDYETLDKARPRMLTRRPVTIKTGKIVVLKAGRMRDIRGVAYIPTRLPDGVNVEDLQ